LVLIDGMTAQLPDGDTLAGVVSIADATNLVAKEALEPGQAVAVTAAGEVMLASAADAVKSEVTGFATAVAALDAVVNVHGEGFLTVGDWTAGTGAAALVAGAHYYLGATAGQITTTAPTTGYLMPVGQAVSATTLAIRLGVRIKL